MKPVSAETILSVESISHSGKPGGNLLFQNGPFCRLIHNLDQSGIRIPRDIQILHLDPIRFARKSLRV